MKNIAGMGRVKLFLESNPVYLHGFLLLLLAPALFINLGLMPMLADEATRATVALEMILSDNYILPTIGGENYYNKPPLFNWILAGVFALTNSYSEFVLRLNAVIPLLVYVAVIYFFAKRYVDKTVAFLSAIAMVTFGRMLFYDAMLGHIDILFSLVTFLAFMAMYHFYQKQKLLALFVVTYALAALGFLMKGLPSILFQGLSLLILFISNKNYKPLFSLRHIVGILTFVVLVGGYYLVLSRYIGLDKYYETLVNESSKRAITGKGFMHNVLYLFMFPVDQLFVHLFPWGLLVVFCFNKTYWRYILSQPFLKFCLLMTAGNIIVYWTSPETRPRYLFMLYPMIFVLLFSGYLQVKQQYRKLARAFDILLMVFAAVACLLLFYVPFFDFRAAVIPHFMLKWAVIVLLALPVLWLLFAIRSQRIVLFMIFLLVARTGFNWFVLPERFYNGREKTYREQMQHIAKVTEGDSLYIHHNVGMGHSELFYLDLARRSIPPRTDTLEYRRGYTLADHQAHIPPGARIADSLHIAFLNQHVFLIQKK